MPKNNLCLKYILYHILETLVNCFSLKFKKLLISMHLPLLGHLPKWRNLPCFMLYMVTHSVSLTLFRYLKNTILKYMCSNVEEVNYIVSLLSWQLIIILFADTAYDKSNWNIAQLYTRRISICTEKY